MTEAERLVWQMKERARIDQALAAGGRAFAARVAEIPTSDAAALQLQIRAEASGKLQQLRMQHARAIEDSARRAADQKKQDPGVRFEDTDAYRGFQNTLSACMARFGGANPLILKAK